MNLTHAVSLVAILMIWAVAWLVGYRWCRSCGIYDRASRWALACVLPTAGLVFAVQLVALFALVSGTRAVTPETSGLVFLAITVLARWVVGPCAAPGHAPSDALSETADRADTLGLYRLPVLVVTAMYLVFLADAVTRYPTGYDATHYHLPIAVTWAQQQRLDLILGLSHQSCPENGMIVPFLLSFAKFERLFTIVHLPKAVLLALVIHGLSRAVSVSRRGAVLSTAVALSIPMVVFQSFSAYVDLYAAASWLSALLALTWARRVLRAGRRGLVLLAGLSAGVALGTKTMFLVLVPLLGVVVLISEWIRSRDDLHVSPKPIRVVAVFAAAALAGSAFWFIRGAA